MQELLADIDGQGQPWLTKFIIDVGAWCALALFLIAAMFGWMKTPMWERLERMEYNDWQRTAIMRAICFNLVPNERKINCEPWKQPGTPP